MQETTIIMVLYYWEEIKKSARTFETIYIGLGFPSFSFFSVLISFYCVVAGLPSISNCELERDY